MAGARGITGWGTHLPYRRLDRATISAVAGAGGGTGTRTVASYDEDTTTMGAEAARAALRGLQAGGLQAGGLQVRRGPQALWFATTDPAYADKTNATVLHAVLRLDRNIPAYDSVGSVRSAMAALRAGWQSAGTTLVVASDRRTGLPGSGDEAAGGDAAAALLIGDGASDGDGARVLAEIVAWESVTEEFTDRWKAPGAPVSKLWEERFGENRYAALGTEALKLALSAAGIGADAVGHLIVAGLHDRAAGVVQKKSGAVAITDRLSATVGNPGAAQPALLLAATLEKARPGQWIVLVSLADGADAVVLRTTDALASYQPYRPVAAQVAAGAPVSYGRYLHWRGFLPVEPPRRPEPARVSSPAAQRNADWKYGFVASVSAESSSTSINDVSAETSGGSWGSSPRASRVAETSGEVHLPPSPQDQARTPMADALGTIVTFTVDKLSYSLSPPVVFAIVDFDGGGRLPIELTDADASEVAIGGRVEMTFRRLSTADAIHNYFWKARPVRGTARGTTARGTV